MNFKYIWIAFAVVYVIQLAVYFIFKPYGESRPFFVDFIAINLTIFTAITILAFLICLIPIARYKYTEKLNYVFPSVGILLSIFGTIMFGKTAETRAKGIDWKLVEYKDIQIPQNLNCISVKNGKFENGFWYIERNGNIQTQIQKETNKKYTVDLVWLTDCEFMILPVAEHKDTTFIKIVKINRDSYECYVGDGKDALKQTFNILR